MYGREVHQIHGTQLFELQVYLLEVMSLVNLEVARGLWCFPFRLHLQLYMAGSEQQALQCHHEVATALLHQFTPPDSFHCISQARKDRRFIKKYEYFRSLVYSLQAGVLVGTRGTLAQSQQLSGKPWLFTIWGNCCNSRYCHRTSSSLVGWVVLSGTR